MEVEKYNDIEKCIATEINEYANQEIYDDINAIINTSDDIAMGIVGILTSWACKPQNYSSIIVARKRLLEFPTEWVEEKIKASATLLIDICDYWEYRRLLELLESISKDLFNWTVSLGENSSDLDICEAVNDFKNPGL